MTTDIDKELTLLGVSIRWTKNDPEDTTVLLDCPSSQLNPDELREVIAALQQALDEVDPKPALGQGDRWFWIPPTNDREFKITC